ncbi:hypothetical protein U1Q18_052195, partial [Sarracenia purpurea var. burkii]
MSAKFAIVGLLIYLVVFDVANGDDNQCEQDLTVIISFDSYDTKSVCFFKINSPQFSQRRRVCQRSVLRLENIVKACKTIEQAGEWCDNRYQTVEYPPRK